MQPHQPCALLHTHPNVQVRIRLCPESRSGELPPASVRALFRQRVRWAIGWEQVMRLKSSRVESSQVRQRVRWAIGWEQVMHLKSSQVESSQVRQRVRWAIGWEQVNSSQVRYLQLQHPRR